MARPWRYPLAVVLPLLSLGSRRLLGDLLVGFPFLTFFPVIFLVSILAGWRAGLLSLLVSLPLAWHYLIPPIDSFALDVSTSLALVGFLLVGALMVWLSALLQAEKRHHAAETERANLLFRELKHRVANILQLSASLLSLRSRDLDERGRQVLNDAASQLQLINTIHDRIAGADEEVAVEAPLRELCALVGKVAADLDCKLHCEGVSLPRNYMIPVALIVHELLNNVVEHAYSDRRAGSVDIAVTLRAEGGWLVSITDEGTGLPPGFSLDASKRQGLKIIHALAAQADGWFKLQPGPQGRGTQAIVAVGASRR